MKKKRALILMAGILCLVGSPPAYAQVFTDTTLNQVIRVEGSAFIGNDSLALTGGSKFSPGAPLNFTSSRSRVFFISPEKELMVIVPNDSLAGYTVEPVRYTYSTRPGKILSYIAFVKFLEGRDWLVLGDSVRLELGREEFPLDEDHFFFIRYQMEGDTLPVNKRLSHREQLVMFSKQEIFRVDGEPVAMESTAGHQLFYYNAPASASTLINSIRLIFPDEAVIKKEVEAIIRYLGIAYPNEEKVRVIENYLFEVYGTPEKENLKEWLNRHFKL